MPTIQGVGIVFFYYQINATAKKHEVELKVRSHRRRCARSFWQLCVSERANDRTSPTIERLRSCWRFLRRQRHRFSEHLMSAFTGRLEHRAA